MLRLLFSLCILFYLLPSSSAFAHTLKTDGSIGAVLHVSPEDDPIAGEVSSFFFEIKDTTGNFETGLCNCTVTITKDDKEILTQPVFADGDSPDLSNTSMIYTFPEKGIYQITLTGTPLQNGQFDSFSLSYNVRVARSTSETPASSSSLSPLLPVIIPVGILLLVSGTVFVIQKNRSISHKRR